MIYNVVINSNNFVGGTNGSNYEYNFDWSNFEEGAYELTFSYNAVASAVSSTLILSIELGTCMNTFTTTSLTSQRFNNTVGLIVPTYRSAGDYSFIASINTNPPVYLNSRPMKSNFMVSTRNIDGALTDVAVDYVLILSFKKI